MCRSHSAEFTAAPTAPRDARDFAARVLCVWGVADPDGVVALLISELVTNSVLHARTALQVTLSVADGKLEIAVRDHDPRSPVPRAARADLLADLDALARRGPADDRDSRDPSLAVGEAGSVLAGRGMLLVDALSDEWGASELADGKVVWAHLGVPPEWPHLRSCPCPRSAQATQLASGELLVTVPGPWDATLSG